MMNQWLHGVHDIDGADLMSGKPGWIVITEAIGSDPHDHSGRDYHQWTARGFSVICRMNNGYSPAGTIPHSNYYDDFSRRCGNFVRATPGISVAIIGNEPNHANERPGGELIIPTQYAKCFDLCYDQIKKNVPSLQVCTAPIAPWDATTTYSGNSNGDWVVYYTDVLNAIRKTDAIGIHTYTHGSDPLLISDTSTMNPPFDDRFFNFPAYIDFLTATPPKYQGLPFYITETDQVNSWANINQGWIQSAMEEIDFWNSGNQPQKVHALCIYRTNKDDQWSIASKDQVKADFRAAVERGYKSPEQEVIITPTPPDNPTEPSIPVVPSDRSIDPVLIARGVNFDYVYPPRGTGYWKIVNAVHLNEQEADMVGPDHHILGTIKRDGREIEGVKFLVTWPTGDTPVYSKKDQVIADYNYDYAMSASLNEFSIWVDDGNPTDKASGIGMGEHGNPGIHTSTWIDWAWTISEGSPITPPIPPIEPPVIPPTYEGRLVHPLPGSVITQHFYQNPQDYARFGMPGHNGTDLGGKSEGTDVLSVADGVVAYADHDASYGFYVRIKHLELGCYTMYCHLTEPGLQAGNVVKAGQMIGSMGMTGNATGPHLHLEVRLMDAGGAYREGTPMPKGRVDPETFFAERGLRI